MAMPPTLDHQAFQDLAGTDKEESERRFERILTGFHQFLNASSTTSGLQSRRAKWASPKGTEAFQNRKFEPEHWYTFNVGGRTEAQLNLGMFPTHLRVGLGFEFTEREHGNPKHVRESFARFHNAILSRRLGFEAVTQALPLELELSPGRGGRFQVIHTQNAIETLLDLPREPEWLFLGRMLRPGEDDHILTTQGELAAELDRVFGALLPWWERANRPLTRSAH